MKMKRYVWTILLVGLVSACALSPQLVDIAPELATGEQSNIGNNQSLLILAEDARPDRVVGSRGGVYADKSQILTGNDVAASLASQVKTHLQARGFNTLNPSDQAQQLGVKLVALGYEPSEGSVVNQVVVSATLEAVAPKREGGEYTRSYTSSITYDQPFTPTASKNEQMLNAVVARCLEKLLMDEALLAQLLGAP